MATGRTNRNNLTRQLSGRRMNQWNGFAPASAGKAFAFREIGSAGNGAREEKEGTLFGACGLVQLFPNDTALRKTGFTTHLSMV